MAVKANIMIDLRFILIFELFLAVQNYCIFLTYATSGSPAQAEGGADGASVAPLEEFVADRHEVERPVGGIGEIAAPEHQVVVLAGEGDVRAEKGVERLAKGVRLTARDNA